jgi:Spy/CpxP family protein refolding chaperone
VVRPIHEGVISMRRFAAIVLAGLLVLSTVSAASANNNPPPPCQGQGFNGCSGLGGS